MKTIDLNIRGYIQQERNGTWLAVCIDLNLVAQGDSPQEARDKLHNIIHDYLLEAFTEDEKYFADLVPRKPPLVFMMRYYWISLLSKLNFSPSRLFTEHLPLVPVNQTHVR